MSALCAGCGDFVAEEARLAHVYRDHVKEKLFTCPGCDYYSTFDYDDVRAHIDEVHPILAVVGVVDHAAIFHKAIDQVVDQCFPGSDIVSRQLDEQTKFIKIETNDRPKDRVMTDLSTQRRSQRIPKRDSVPRMRYASISPEPPTKRRSSKIAQSRLNNSHSDHNSSVKNGTKSRGRKSEALAVKEERKSSEPTEPLAKRGRRSAKRFSPSQVKTEESSKMSRRYPRRENATCLVERSPSPEEPQDDDFDSPKPKRRSSQARPPRERPSGLTPLNARYFAPRSHPNQKRGADRFCFECNKIVKGSTRHIYNYHLKQPLFRCPLCPHSSTYDKQSVQDHIGRVHEGKGLAIDAAEEYQKEMAEWNFRCWWSKDANAVQPMDASSTEEDDKKLADNKVYCHVCKDAVHRLKKQHVLEVHVKKPMYQCPHCEFFSMSSKQRVNRHARTKHPGAGPSLSAIDREPEHHDLIVEWEHKCWPDDYKEEKSPPSTVKTSRRSSNRLGVKIAFKWKPRRLRGVGTLPTTSANNSVSNAASRVRKRESSYCQVCCALVSAPRVVHLYREHLKRPLFKCPHCPFYSTYAKYRVSKHVSAVHRNEIAKDIIDLLRDQTVLDEIAKLETACWVPKNDHENGLKKKSSTADQESDEKLVECLLCKEKVNSRKQQMHIYKEHLKVDDLFYCSKCGFKSSFNSNAVRRHVARLHADGEGYTSKITEFVDKLVELENSCFHENDSPARKQQKLWAPCQQCSQSVMMCRRPMHVLIDHMNVADMFSCRHCDIKSAYKRSYVMRHSRRQHNDANINSRMDQFQDMVDTQTKLCFPLAQKPMKRFIGLTKTGASTSTCYICNKVQTEGAAHHVRRSHLPPLFKSAACPFTTYSFVQVQDHVRTHHAHVYHAGGQFVINDSPKYAAEFAKAHKLCFDEPTPSPQRKKRAAKKVPPSSVLCQLCLNVVLKSERLQHIYEMHLAADDLFKCAQCPFSSSCSMDAVAQHSLAVHERAGGEVVSRVAELSWKIAQFETACFSPNSNRLSRQCNAAFVIKNFCTDLSRPCKVCKDNKDVDRNRMKEHIWKRHMPTLPYCCAHCAENRYELRAIKEHLAKYHKDETPVDPQYTDKTEQLKEAMIEKFIECFGD